jgi:beta-glucosidase
MPSFNSWNGLKCSGNKFLLTDLLKKELGFKGFLISDWAAINDLPGDYKDQIEQSINAGMDMVMVPDKYPLFFAQLKELVEQGRVPMSRIDDAVTRILRVKFAMGLMDPRHKPFSDQTLQKKFGSQAHRLVALQAVRESQVLLKNEKKILPLKKELKRIVVAGENADNIGNQTGGWTVSWQGKSGNTTQGGTTILKAIRDTVSKSTQVTFSVDGSKPDGAEAGIVVVGETPYAEMFGDREDLRLSDADVKAIQNLKQSGMPVVVVIVSGRPLILDKILDQSDAILAAWLPGTEGQGVADVLFGITRPTGKLSVSWPKSMQQVSSNVGDAGYDPLFAFGFGLTYD